MDDETRDELTDKERELIEKIATLEQDKTNLVGEIKELRQKREPQEQKSTDTPASPAVDPKEVVLAVLADKEREQVEANFNLAKEEVKKKFKELSPDVDQGGILFQKFERELNKFNLNGLKSKEDFLSRFTEAYKLMASDKPDSKVNFYAGASDTTGSPAKTDDGATLTGTEQKLIQEIGWTKEKYLAEKAKRPQYVATLLRYR